MSLKNTHGTQPIGPYANALSAYTGAFLWGGLRLLFEIAACFSFKNATADELQRTH